MKTTFRTSDVQASNTQSNASDRLHDILRSINNSMHSGIVRRINIGYPHAGNRRGTLTAGLELLSNTITTTPPGANIHRSIANSAGERTATIIQSLRTYSGSGDLNTNGDNNVLSRQISLTDFCFPDAEMPGLIVLSMRHPLDINSEHLYSTPAGRDPRALESAWYELSELAAVSVNRLDGSGVRPSLLSLSFLIASRAGDYADKCGAEAVRAHVISNYGRRRIEDRLDRFGSCQAAMLRCHVFPHRHMQVLGGMVSWIAQREIASITAVVKGSQESARTEQTNNPRSSVYVPACAYLDLDKEIHMLHDDRASSLLYLVFVYAQHLGRESIRVYLMRSRLGESVFREGLGYLYSGLRAGNAINGLAGIIAPHGVDANTEFPLSKAFEVHKHACRNTGIGPRDSEKVDWRLDLRGRPTKNSCMYAAYCRVGHLNEYSMPAKKSERCGGSVEVPVVWVPGVVWDIGEWTECYQ
ncbi:UL38 protein [Gallid alphaherpesvirus 3]|uniref:UL38 product homolog n=2 Tax=Gallid alphaherpesvirus 3 TaxID=35250 RepID=Q9WSX5_9ALPH|nr:capsid triplex subunit 1 [Gallid alphaherpesvirus 3]BAA78727.1 UL38 protein [Marek's disease virus serotype 2 MDV2]BAA82934.1 UL38 product homolog [Marek's disease virus serotype 2 MDV2]BAB16548.1 UL38 protein [Gallid alphaherpesvirus 3]